MKRKDIYDRYGRKTVIGYRGEIRFSEWEGHDLVNCPTKEDVAHQKERLAFDFWLCVDEDGREQIMTNSYGLPPVRSTVPEYWRGSTLASVNDNLRAKHCGIWMMRCTTGMFTDSGPWANGPDVAQCPLPKGSIRRLIGFDLTWEDDPVLLQRGEFEQRKISWLKRVMNFVKKLFVLHYVPFIP